MALVPGEDAWWVYRTVAAARDVRMWRPWVDMLRKDAATAARNAFAEAVAAEAEDLVRQLRELAPPGVPGKLRNSVPGAVR